MGVKGSVCGPRGTHLAGRCVPVKIWEMPFIPAKSDAACPRHDPWKCRKTAKSCKGETQVPNAIIGTNQLRETTPTEKPRSSKEAEVEHKASNLVSKKHIC